MGSVKQTSVRATYMRGGTSKGVFFETEDLPKHITEDRAALDRFLMRVIGSPDPYGKQIDGMGAATSSTSKVVVIGRSERPDCDIDYLFGAVSIESAVVDWSGNCGNLTSAVGPFAIARGLLSAPTDGVATVRIWQANLGKRIVAHVPMQDGAVAEIGDFVLDGVTFPAAEILLEFLDPGSDEDGSSSALFPTGNRIETIEVPGRGPVEVTLMNAGNPTVFIDAASLGLSGAEMQSEVNENAALLKELEYLRAHATVRMGLSASAEEATEKRPHTPKIAFVSKPRSFLASSGQAVDAATIDLNVRIMSMGKLHHAMTGTGAVAIAAGCAIPDTIVSRVLKDGPKGKVRFGHPSGSLLVGADAIERDGSWRVIKVIMSRSSRRLMDGVIFVPEAYVNEPQGA